MPSQRLLLLLAVVLMSSGVRWRWRGLAGSVGFGVEPWICGVHSSFFASAKYDPGYLGKVPSRHCQYTEEGEFACGMYVHL